ncbi:MAG: alkyl hydroperoxide reductase [Candidatus Eremiobacteraeota bacterium]|nr:alkyl hydroperoxide reductase [Candidatus Eremiobacteraeota bacterium]
MYERERARFDAFNAQVVGVSTDSRFANAAWAAQLGIKFPLLSDFYPHGAVTERYGVLNPRGMPERAIFVVDKDGIVRYIDVHLLKEAPDPAVLFAELEKLAG